jgi:hypothetical protein
MALGVIRGAISPNADLILKLETCTSEHTVATCVLYPKNMLCSLSLSLCVCVFVHVCLHSCVCVCAGP